MFHVINIILPHSSMAPSTSVVHVVSRCSCVSFQFAIPLYKFIMNLIENKT